MPGSEKGADGLDQDPAVGGDHLGLAQAAQQDQAQAAAVLLVGGHGGEDPVRVELDPADGQAEGGQQLDVAGGQPRPGQPDRLGHPGREHHPQRHRLPCRSPRYPASRSRAWPRGGRS